eukprot:gene893-biopygen644
MEPAEAWFKSDLISSSKSSSDDDCCAKCKAEPKCGSFVRGPYNRRHPILTCFLLRPVNGTFKVATDPDRTYGCVRAA